MCFMRINDPAIALPNLLFEVCQSVIASLGIWFQKSLSSSVWLTIHV